MEWLRQLVNDHIDRMVDNAIQNHVETIVDSLIMRKNNLLEILAQNPNNMSAKKELDRVNNALSDILKSLSGPV